jgi:hypothetical protein
VRVFVCVCAFVQAHTALLAAVGHVDPNSGAVVGLIQVGLSFKGSGGRDSGGGVTEE